jgi:hypothetical protein
MDLRDEIVGRVVQDGPSIPEWVRGGLERFAVQGATSADAGLPGAG